MTNRFLKNGLYNVAAGVVRIGLAVITIPVLIRLLGIEEYGLWTLASAVIGIVGLAEAGLSTATTVFISRDLANEDTEGLSQTLTVTVGAMLILATLAAIALWFGAEPIVRIFPKLGQAQQSALIQALQFGGLVVWAKLLQQVLIGIEQGYQRYDLLNLVNIMQWLLLSLGFFVVAWSGGRTVALMQWQAFISMATLLSHIWAVYSIIKDVNFHISWKKPQIIEVVNFSLMTWLTTIGFVIFARGDRLVVGALLGSNLLGVYATITEVAGVINSFSALPVQPLLPSISSIVATTNNDKTRLQKQIKQALEINTLFALCLATALFSMASLVMQLLLGDQVSSKYVFAFRIATVIYALYSLNAVGYFVLYSVKALRENMIIHLCSGTLSLVLIAIGSSKFGLIGAIFGNAGYLGVWFLTYYAMKYLNINTITWIKWLKKPIIVFGVFSLIGFLSTENLVLMAFLGIVQISILAKWFFDSYQLIS